MGWIIGSIYGFVMLFVGFYLSHDEWVQLIDNPESYECSYLDEKELCDKKMELKELLLKEKTKNNQDNKIEKG